MSTLLDRYFEPPPELQRELGRIYVLGLYAYPAIGAFHFTWIFVFAALDVPLLAWLNVVSTAMWAAGIWLHRHGRFYAALALIQTEIAVHATIATSIFGLNAAYHYYLIPIAATVFLFPARLWKQLVVAAANTMLFMGLHLWFGAHPPVSPVAAEIVSWLGVSNIASAVFVLSVVTFYYSRAAENAEAALEVAHERSEDLLHNILPVPVADKLKTGGQVIADAYPSASVLFADIVNFTPMAERATPQEIVQLLNRVFSEIDDMVEERGLEKIKMIGDAYMVAAGVPEPRSDHASVMSDFALDLRKSIEQHRYDDGQPLQVRIGISSGPLVAGVIGKRKFAYDLWGDTVNTAARMESHGIPGEIQISQTTRDLLGSDYIIEPRGQIAIKGKGEIQTFLLQRRRRQPAP
jgi:adenylate cyclase